MNTRTQIYSNQSPIALSWSIILSLILLMISSQHYLLNHEINEQLGRFQHHQNEAKTNGLGLIMLAEGHIVLTRDDRGSSLVLTGEDGKGGKGGKGGGDDDQLVIAGDQGGGGGGGGGRNTNMIVQDASNREGDVVINGNSMIVPGEDGHIVLADGRSQGNERSQHQQPPPPPPNLFAFWLPYMNSRMSYRMAPFFGGQFG